MGPQVTRTDRAQDRPGLSQEGHRCWQVMGREGWAGSLQGISPYGRVWTMFTKRMSADSHHTCASVLTLHQISVKETEMTAQGQLDTATLCFTTIRDVTQVFVSRAVQCTTHTAVQRGHDYSTTVTSTEPKPSLVEGPLDLRLAREPWASSHRRGSSDSSRTPQEAGWPMRSLALTGGGQGKAGCMQGMVPSWALAAVTSRAPPRYEEEPASYRGSSGASKVTS